MPTVETLTQQEFKHLLNSTETLIQIKGQWVQVDNEKLDAVLSHWKSIERRVKKEGLSFSEGLRLISGVSQNEMVEVWALGVLTYEFICGEPPFQAETNKETYKRILNIDIHYPSHVAPDARDFISRLLKRKPEERMLLTDALDHPWLDIDQDQ